MQQPENYDETLLASAELFHLIVENVKDYAVFMIDADGRVVSWNPGIERILGYAENEIVGQSAEVIFTPEDRAAGAHRKEMETAARTGRAEDKRWHLRKDGSRFWANGLAMPLKNEDGELRGFAKIMRDETAQKLAERKSTERERLALLNAEISESLIKNDSLPDILHRCTDAIVKHLDAAFARVWTLDKTENVLELKASSGIYTHLDGEHARVPVGEFKIGWIAEQRQPHLTNSVVGDGRVANQDWAKREGMVAFAGYPLLVEDKLIGVAAMFARQPLGEQTLDALAAAANIIALGIERKQADEAARNADELYRTVAQATNDAIWDWSLATNKLAWNDGVRTLFGYEPEQVSDSIDWWYEHLHPDDRDRVVESIHHVIDTGGQQWSDEYRFINSDGSFAKVYDRGFVIRDREGNPVRMLGGMTDLTERKRAQEALNRLTVKSEQQRRLYDTILSTTPDLVYVFGLDHRFTYANKTLLAMWGKTWDEAIGKTCLELGYEPWHAEMHDREIEQVKRTKQPIRGEVPFAGTNGRRIYDYIFTPVIGAYGEVEAVAGTTRDVTDSKQAQRNAEFLAEISEDMTLLTTIDEIMRTVGAKIGAHLNLSLCAFIEVDQANDKAAVTHDWHCEDVPGLIGVYHLPDFVTSEFRQAALAGQTVAVRDVYTDERIADPQKYAALKIGAELNVPLMKEDEWKFSLAAFHEKSYDWREDEIELMRELASRIWTRIARARAEEERERLLESEQIAREEAERANRLKDEFLATLSHELRTPLNAILGWSQMLQNQNLDPDSAKKALSTIERNARAQNQLIDDLLDVSRIITGKLRLDVRAVDLPSVISAAVDAARPAAEAKNIRLQALLDPQAGPISGDPDRLQQIVWNLLSNAIKFTPKGGRVQVRLERINSHVEIVVSDTGKGIEPEFLPFVFERFRQSDGSMTRRHGGLGLGLAIVRQLVELHGGEVSVSSAGEGHGATFVVNLPLLPVRQEPASDVPRVHPSAETNALQNCPPELSGLRVLLVDDEADSRDLLNIVLDSCGAVVTTATSASEALAAVKREKFDVLISDIGMPDEDGFSLIRKIRALPAERGGAIPAIALTAYARAEDRINSLRLGFQMHIPKPVENLELITAVANLAGRIERISRNGNAES